WVVRPGSPSRPRVQPSARSRGTARARPWRRSSPSRCAGVSGSEPEGAPTAEELVEEFRKAKVEDFLVHTCSLLASLGFGKLAPEARDLAQARLAIEGLKALLP